MLSLQILITSVFSILPFSYVILNGESIYLFKFRYRELSNFTRARILYTERMQNSERITLLFDKKFTSLFWTYYGDVVFYKRRHWILKLKGAIAKSWINTISFF